MNKSAAIWTAIIITNILTFVLFRWTEQNLNISGHRFIMSGVMQMTHKDGTVFYTPVYEKENTQDASKNP